MNTATEYTENGQATTAAAVWRQYAGEELVAQEEARAAVLAMKPNELRVGLIRALGPTEAKEMMVQFIYWLRRPSMANRWSMYKTFTEWSEEVGLTRRHVDKGRERLKAAGLVAEEKGPYKRVHYQVDWVRLAQTLNLNPIAQAEPDGNGVGMQEMQENERAISDCTTQNGHTPHNNEAKPPDEGVQYRLHNENEGDSAGTGGPNPHSYRENSDQGADETNQNLVQTNTGNYAGNYSHINSSLQEGAPAASQATQPAAPQPIKEENLKGQGTAAPTHQRPRHPATSDTAAQQASKGWPKPAPEPPQLDRLEQHQVWRLLLDEHDSIPHRFACAHLRGATAGGAPVTVEVVAEKVREAHSSKHPTAAYMAAVKRGLEQLHDELQPVSEPTRAAV